MLKTHSKVAHFMANGRGGKPIYFPEHEEKAFALLRQQRDLHAHINNLAVAHGKDVAKCI